MSSTTKFYIKHPTNGSEFVASDIREPSPGKSTVTVGLVICGDKMPEAFAMMTSLVLFSRQVDLDLRIFQNQIFLEQLILRLKELQVTKATDKTNLSYRIYDTWFPHDQWHQIWPICSTQRLFFPLLLPDVENIIYLDADTLFFSNVLDLWKYFGRMNKTQFAAMGPDGMPPAKGTYSGASFPFYGPRGLNSGVLLMNLTRMREVDFVNEMPMLFRGYGRELNHGEQDLLNIYFHFHPQFFYLLPCNYNYGHQLCECDKNGASGSCACKTAERSGISILHGCNQQFRSKTLNIFQQVYQFFSEFNLSNGTLDGLLLRLKQNHAKYKLKSGKCSQLNLTIYSKFEIYVQGKT
ncbi:unnamed protein product [Allacma fusca]|uniref:Glucoside xylosyltransferase 2 n=1 Tax=Allacma fusca TaxID=39272 RepID=A0A8J2LGK4_9HEXA|nr:unnamed protein product [Allacma fusca]